jgi:pyrroline-5-carboxylate reductase
VSQSQIHILLVGCGRMGTALLHGWLAGWPEARFSVIDHTPPATTERVHSYPDINSVPQDTKADLIVLAVKPQQLAELAPACARFGHTQSIFLSIAAGITLSRLQGWLEPDAASDAAPGIAIVRAMPNTPASIGQGISAIIANTACPPEGLALASRALQAAGAVVQVEEESWLDAVTALSGSGPAYLFRLTEVLTEAGISLGLPASLSAQLARHTMCGAAALMQAESDTTPAALREAVTSKGGTTAAALSVLNENEALQQLFTKALHAATQRAKELANS